VLGLSWSLPELLEFDDGDIDAIEQGAGDAVAILLDLAPGAAAFAARVAEVAAGAGHQATVNGAWMKRRKSSYSGSKVRRHAGMRAGADQIA